MTIMTILAEADAAISGGWVLKLIAQIFAGVGVLITAAWAAYKKGQQSPETTTKIKPNPFKVKEVKALATKEELRETEVRIGVRIGRVEEEVADIRDDQQTQFKQLLESGAARESRIADKIDLTARETHRRIDELLRDQAKGGSGA